MCFNNALRSCTCCMEIFLRFISSIINQSIKIETPTCVIASSDDARRDEREEGGRGQGVGWCQGGEARQGGEVGWGGGGRADGH
jgi:hypothetical protein